MTRHDRIAIDNDLRDVIFFKAIARSINKDCMTVSKEIRIILKLERLQNMVIALITMLKDLSATNSILFALPVLKLLNVLNVLKDVISIVQIMSRNSALSFPNLHISVADTRKEMSVLLPNITIYNKYQLFMSTPSLYVLIVAFINVLDFA